MTDKTSIKETAEALLDGGKLSEAIVEYRALAMYDVDEAIRLRPGWAFYHNKKGKILEDKGELLLAITELKTAIAIKPDLEDARKGLRRLERKMKRLGRKEN